MLMRELGAPAIGVAGRRRTVDGAGLEDRDVGAVAGDVVAGRVEQRGQ